MKKTTFVAIAILAIILGIVAYASAAGVNTVDVTANVSSKLDLTLTGTSYGFGAVMPDAGQLYSPAGTLSVAVKSNKLYSITSGWGGTAFTDDFVDIPTAVAPKTSGQSYAYQIGFLPTYAQAGAVSDTLTFTAAQ